MYPHVTQFETRDLKLERELESIERKPAGPQRYKLALLTWAGAYALITLILAVAGPTMASWPLALRTLVLSAAMVVALTWLVMPRLTRLCRGWLQAPA